IADQLAEAGGVHVVDGLEVDHHRAGLVVEDLLEVTGELAGALPQFDDALDVEHGYVVHAVLNDVHTLVAKCNQSLRGRLLASSIIGACCTPPPSFSAPRRSIKPCPPFGRSPTAAAPRSESRRCTSSRAAGCRSAATSPSRCRA